MTTGPKMNAFLAACGVAAAGLGVVSAGMPFLEKQKAEQAAAASKPAEKEADVRPCSAGEQEAARAALYNYGKRLAEDCFLFSKGHTATLSACEVDKVTRRINARGKYDWKGGVGGRERNFTAAFTTDLAGTDIRVNITARSRDRDEKCEKR